MANSSAATPEDELYDIVIEGTGLTESILSAAAAWAGKKVIHVDKNSFYGSHWAALSISALDEWTRQHSGSDTFPCSSATLKRLPTSTLLHPSRLQSSRSYAIDSSPHLLYCSSDLVSCLANTRLSTYLEFKALEHICIFQRNHANQREITLEKVPSSREDVFTSTLSLREKRQLMKFLTNAVNAESLEYPETMTLDQLLSSPEYNLPQPLRNVIQYAIALSPTPEMPISEALPAIKRHLTGFGVYGQFPIIVPLFGGGGELSQAFCRAAAVKGATYILGREIKQISRDTTNAYPFKVDFNVAPEDELASVRSRYVVRPVVRIGDYVDSTRRIAVFEGIFGELFRVDGTHVDAALIVVPPGTLRDEQLMPIQMIVHGGGIGECPDGQWVVYSSVRVSGKQALEDLELAEQLIVQYLSKSDVKVEPLLLATYKCRAPKSGSSGPAEDGILYVNPPKDTKDYDNAFHEAKSIFSDLFGDEEGFLVGDDTEDIEPDED